MFLAAFPVQGAATELYVAGSTDGVGGPDAFVLRNNSVVNGGVDLQMGSGDKNVALDSSRMLSFEMSSGVGNDNLWIGGTTITTDVLYLLGHRQRQHLAAKGQYEPCAGFAARRSQRDGRSCSGQLCLASAI